MIVLPRINSLKTIMSRIKKSFKLTNTQYKLRNLDKVFLNVYRNKVKSLIPGTSILQENTMVVRGEELRYDHPLSTKYE